MALGFKEKRELQKIVAEKQDAIETGGLGFKDKREAQKAMQAALERLGEAIDTGADTPLLRKLLNHDFDSLAPLPFLAKLEDVVKELNGDVKPVLEPVVAYVEKNAKGIVLEA